MATYSFTIRPGGVRSGQVSIEGHGEMFFDGQPPDAFARPLEHAAAALYIAVGDGQAMEGTISVTAAAD